FPKQTDHRQGANLINLGLTWETIKKTGRDPKLHTAPSTTTHHDIKEGVTVDLRVGNDHFVSFGISDGLRQRLEITNNWHTLVSVRHLWVYCAILDNTYDAVAKRWTF